MSEAGQRLGKWILRKPLGSGGNGAVWRAESVDGGADVAIKVLTKNHPVAKQRFADEVTTQQHFAEQDVALPILGQAEATEEERWFAMPIATPLTKALEKAPVRERIAVFEGLAKILSFIHGQAAAHRDIKPDNIMVHEGRPLFSDFGLVTFPKKTKITGKNERVGPAATIAPEMRAAGRVRNAQPADVYSFAKSLWMVLTQNDWGFEGEYGPWAREQLTSAFKSQFIEPLHALLAAATSTDASKRPPAANLAATLQAWAEQDEDIKIRSPQQWKALQAAIFPHGAPERTSWTNLAQIERVLRGLAAAHAVHHTMLPDGGGLDLHGVGRGTEEETLELTLMGTATIVRPSRLEFAGFEQHPDWNYFKLEAAPLPMLPGEPAWDREQLTQEYLELPGLGLASAQHWYDDEWCGSPLPERSRHVVRCRGGKFLWVHRTSQYNKNPATYHPYHSLLSDEEFRQAMERWATSGSPGWPADAKNRTVEPDIAEPSPNTPKFIPADMSWWNDPTKRPSLRYVTPQQVLHIAEGWVSASTEERPLLLDLTDTDAVLALLEAGDDAGEANQKLLAPLSDDEMREVLMLYYFARGDLGACPRKEQWEELRRSLTQPREQLEEQLLEKSPAPRFLRQALELLK